MADTDTVPFLKYADVYETAPHRFTVDASDLGLPPGRFPASFQTDMGNQQPFHYWRDDGHAWYYRQQFGCLTLIVFND